MAENDSSAPDGCPFIVLFHLALATILFLDPVLFWSDNLYLSLYNNNDNNQTMIWFDDPWIALCAYFQEKFVPDCTHRNLSIGDCRSAYFGFILFCFALVLVFVLAVMALYASIFYLECQVKNHTVQNTITWAIDRFSNRFPFKEPNIVYSLRNLIDYVIIVGVFLPQFRLSRFYLFVLTIVLTRLGQLFSITSLRSLFYCARTFFVDIVFLGCIYPMPYAHIVTRNSVCFLIEAIVKTRLLIKCCMYWFIRSVETLPSPNVRIKRTFPLIKSENISLDNLCFIFDFCDISKKKPWIQPRDRIFLLDEILVACFFAILATINPEMGSDMHIIFAVSCALLITVYFCRGVSGPKFYKMRLFLDNVSSKTVRKYLLATNLLSAEAILIIAAVCIYFYPWLNCFASILTACILSVIITRLSQIFCRLRLPLSLVIFDTVVVVIGCIAVFAALTHLPSFNQFVFAKFQSSFVFLTLIAFTSHISMGMAIIQTIYISRLIYKFTKRLTQQLCFHFENQGYLLVKEFLWRDPERKSKFLECEIEAHGFYDRSTMDKMGIAVNDCVFITSPQDLNTFAENIIKCINDRLNDYILDCENGKELRKQQLTTAGSVISNGIDFIRNHYDKRCGTITQAASLVQENSVHWIIRIQKDLLIDEKELLKALADYEAIKKSLQDLLDMISTTRQLALYLGVRMNDVGFRVQRGKIEDIEKKLTDKNTELEELFNRILIPLKEALYRSKSKEENSEGSVSDEPQVVVHQHSIEDEPPEVESFDEDDDEKAIGFLLCSGATNSPPEKFMVSGLNSTELREIRSTRDKTPEYSGKTIPISIDEVILEQRDSMASSVNSGRVAQPLNASIFLLCANCNAKSRDGSATKLEGGFVGLQIFMCPVCVSANDNLQFPFPKRAQKE